MVKVVYTDGSSEVFEADNVLHNPASRLFIIKMPNSKIFIPENAVRSAGVGHIEEITEGNLGGFEVKREVFVYE